MDRGRMIAAVAVSAAITFFLRALPFFAFRDGRKMPEKLKRLGGILPSVSYKYRHHTMLSIALGTVCNIILLYFSRNSERTKLWIRHLMKQFIIGI